LAPLSRLFTGVESSIYRRLLVSS